MSWDMVTIDPGANDTAMAVWTGNTLARLTLFVNTRELTKEVQLFLEHKPVFSCYVENQHIDKRANIRARNIIDVAFWAGAAAHAVPAMERERIAPNTWKGQQPKHVTCSRTLSKMFPEELRIFWRAVARFTAKPASAVEKAIRMNRLDPQDVKRATDLLDAVGIGLYIRGRL